jgi:uncharacterized membrane protein
VDKEGETSFGALFYYYKKDYYIKLVVIQLIISVLTNFSSMVFGLLGPVGGLLNYISMFFIYTLFVFSMPLIIYKKASIGQAINLSLKLVFANFGSVLAIQLIFAVFAFLGVFACGIGILFSMAFLPVAQYLLYKYSVGFPEDSIEPSEQTHWQQQPPTS